ncbi:MAG: SDR family NAD(P)-dependent oxidoreductase [Bacteroidia bacterium]|nr:SDR family NAD(P)-dependent oxidoreductase [Bacteroidia bacterium]
MQLSLSEKNRLANQYGPWAVVTGASSGMGRELAICLAEAGFKLVLTARRNTLLDALATELKTRYQTETQVIAADLSEEAGVYKVFEATANLEVGLLIAAAGFGTSGDFLKSSLPEELEMLHLNCKGLFLFTHHYSLQFAKQGRGGIILLSSIVSFQGVPYAAHYAATKAYVQSLAEALSIELKPQGVDLLAAAPAPVYSDFAARAGMQMGMAMKPADVAVPILKALGRKTTVLPGFLTRLLVGSLRTLPRWGKIQVMKQVMGGMTAGKRKPNC